MKFRPYVASSDIWCSQHRGKAPREGSVQIPVGSHHYRVICARCNEMWMSELIREKNREAIEEQRQELKESRERMMEL